MRLLCKKIKRQHLTLIGMTVNHISQINIPSLGELLRIYLYRHVIDEALLTIPGTPLRNEYYWTSTFCSCVRSYVVFMGDGTVNELNACETMNRVRLVSKFL